MRNGAHSAGAGQPIRRAGKRLAAVGLAFGAALLLSAGSPASDSPLADAVMRGDSAGLRVLLKQGADVNEVQGDGMTALHWAASRGNLAATRMLVSAGARLDPVTRNGNYTPLHLAAQNGRAETVKALLAAGANVKATTSSGGASALHFAASSGDAATIDALVDKGASVNVREAAFSQTPLMWAAAANRVAAITALIKRGADIEAETRTQSIPEQEKKDRAFLVTRSRRLAAMKSAEALLAPTAAASAPAGAPAATPRTAPPTVAASASAKDAVPTGNSDTRITPTAGDRRPRGPSYGDLVGSKGGNTALLLAVRDGQTAAVNALLMAGAKVNHASAGDSTTPLLMAAINGRFDLAKTLLDRGADPKLASTANATPLYAVINVVWAPKAAYPQPVAQYQSTVSYLELMEALIKAGADVNVRLTKHLWYMSYNFDQLSVSTAGATPFWRAAYGTDLDAMKLLLKYGADPNVATIKPAGRLPGSEELDADVAAGKDPSGLPPVPDNGPGVMAIHAASGAGYGEGFAANAHRHAPDSWVPTVKFLVEELKADVNARDFKGYTPLHHAAARGDNELIKYLVSKGADVMAVARTGQTTVDMANGAVQRVPPFLDTIELLEKMGAKNNHKCKSC
ncbi:ankyrin repeat domain-containing protein [Gemmatimonas sp.]|jgi:ankyrin repeat protein|uniref:ankyrin repeat domain-containing protein n=1 Tax=Gemmatimonas sp. TaxID=1962908 RepID=UPI0037BEB870